MPEQHTSEVKPYDEQVGSKKEQVTNMFDKIAPYYDLLNGVLSLGIDTIWRRNTIKKIAPSNPQTILDIATGTADLAIEAQKQLAPVQVTGLDISPNMIEIGNDKLRKANLTDSISLEVGDSEQLRFDDESFDAATVAFGVRNFGDLKKGLAEIHRVLSSDGQLAVLEFSKPRLFPFKQLYHFYFKNILPFIGRMTSKDPKAYKYLYESVQVFPDYDDFAIILKEIGFKDVTWSPQTLGICTIYLAKKS